MVATLCSWNKALWYILSRQTCCKHPSDVPLAVYLSCISSIRVVNSFYYWFACSTLMVSSLTSTRCQSTPALFWHGDSWGQTPPWSPSATSSRSVLSSSVTPHGLTFMWWWCFGFCQRHQSTELAHSFLLCSYVCFSLMSLSTVFHSINSSDNSPFSHSALPVLSLRYWSFQLYVSLWKSPSALI